MQTYVPPAAPAAVSGPTPAANVAQPQAPAAEPKPALPNTTNFPPESPATPAAQPEPGAEKSERELYKVEKGDGATYLQPPKLFDPKDRTAKRGSMAPVHTAVYQQPVSYRQTSIAPRGPISAAQAQQDAIGWSTAK